MDPQSRIRSVELDYKARRGELIHQLGRAGHHPKITVVLLGEEMAFNYRIRLSCTRCEQTRRRWPLNILWGLRASRPCPASPSRI